MKSVSIALTTALTLCSTGAAAQLSEDQPRAANPVEVGSVAWGRDVDAALERGAATGKPVFVLFQEVPGCAGCQDFGKTVLTEPLLVEAIEDEFVPVLVRNNAPGKDRETLERFKEPAWNYQVVRFLDGQGRDLIPRKDRVWTAGALAARMVQTLEAAERPVPRYLAAFAQQRRETGHETAAFAQHCFWVGEAMLGRIDGVITTEAGWFEGREVTRVVFDPDQVSLEELATRAQRSGCADKVYARGNPELEGFEVGVLGRGYSTARASDQKRQLKSWDAVREVPDLLPVQLTKLNALAPSSRAEAVAWLSPRQRAALDRAEQPKRQDRSVP